MLECLMFKNVQSIKLKGIYIEKSKQNKEFMQLLSNVYNMRQFQT